MAGTDRDYYDIDDILMAEENIVCTFNVAAKRLGFLDQSADSSHRDGVDGEEENLSEEGEEEEEEDEVTEAPGLERQVAGDLQMDAKVELPYWLAETLARRKFVMMQLPRHYNAKVRNDLRAGPVAVNLSDRSSYFFELGFRLSALLIDDELAEILRKGYAERCWRVVDSAGWEGKVKGLMVAMKKLDSRERHLYMLVTNLINAYGKWKERCAERIGPARKHRKRPFEESTRHYHSTRLP
mmetsp:Transcript_16475/g.67768  ORF Transcript_16475/g.67768 Transcript_16475/m.67768 type:complete len:240 (-) Transcript_16475:478-1197(-)|eukprot:CAMPEP_0113969684 /NCGR_PEP_ID=MMETSP0011_2-20120614/10517_1 /TAXON_ID=101924 /ORGANISM="Rhodosorus marinus" /LENGTH=239 /DNA_ID=CAMNT_0000983495 /DNA_START=123 /DNA_END=842 /DNA_ORIENTATION=- /assembly_acc=CAM_ASM_000156